MNDRIASLIKSEAVQNLFDEITRETLKRSCQTIVECIIIDRQKIVDDGPKQYILDDISDCMEWYKKLSDAYNYYSPGSEYLPTLEEALKDAQATKQS